MKYSTTSYEELKNNPKFTTAFHGVNTYLSKKANLSGKGSFMEEHYGFSIDSTYIHEARKEGYVSYTMYIQRETPSTLYFENLVIETKNKETTKAYVVQYFPKTPIKTTQHDSFIFEYDFNFIPIQYEEGRESIEFSCHGFTVPYCSYGDDGDHIATSNCTPGFINDVFFALGPCDGGDIIYSGPSPSFPNNPSSGDYPGYNPNNNSNGGGGVPNPNAEDNNTYTNPIPCYKVNVDCPELELMEEDPCDELNNMSKEKPYLNVLKGKVYSTREFGYYFDEGIPGVTEAELQSPSSLSILKMPVGGSIYGSSHNHPYMVTTNRLPMFAIEDMMWIGKAYYANTTNPKPPISKFFNTLTVNINNANYHFAVKIENKQEFLLSFYEQYLTLSKLEKFNLEDKLIKEYTKIKKNGGNFKKFVEALYKFLEEKEINGIGIYKANLNNNNDIDNWSKLEFEPNNVQNPITAVPCE